MVIQSDGGTGAAADSVSLELKARHRPEEEGTHATRTVHPDLPEEKVWR